MAMTIVNCGSGYLFFAPSVYAYLCGSPLDTLEIGDDEIPNYETKKMIEKVYRKLSCILDLSCELVPSTPRI